MSLYFSWLINFRHYWVHIWNIFWSGRLKILTFYSISLLNKFRNIDSTIKIKLCSILYACVGFFFSIKYAKTCAMTSPFCHIILYCCWLECLLDLASYYVSISLKFGIQLTIIPFEINTSYMDLCFWISNLSLGPFWGFLSDCWVVCRNQFDELQGQNSLKVNLICKCYISYCIRWVCYLLLNLNLHFFYFSGICWNWLIDHFIGYFKRYFINVHFIRFHFLLCRFLYINMLGDFVVSWIGLH